LTLLEDPQEAQRMGENARRYAQDRFGIERFAADWEGLFALVCGRGIGQSSAIPVATVGSTI
jgi:glycosyltransferase involved in cell wall biosynthesis